MECDEHTHAGAINVDLLGSGGLVVEVQSTVLDVEGSLLLLGTSATGTLARQTSEDAALSSVEGRVLDVTARVNSHNTKSLRLGGRGGRDNGADGSSDGEVLDLHIGGEGVE